MGGIEGDVVNDCMIESLSSLYNPSLLSNPVQWSTAKLASKVVE